MTLWILILLWVLCSGCFIAFKRVENKIDALTKKLDAQNQHITNLGVLVSYIPGVNHFIGKNNER